MKLWNWFLSLFKKKEVAPPVTITAPIVPIAVSPIVSTPSFPSEVKKGPLFGIDVYSLDKDWTKLDIRNQLDFISIKASQGTGNVQSKFAPWRKAAKELGIPMQAYHYAEVGNPEGQARHFCDVIGNIETGELPPCLDLEHTDNGIMNPADALIFLKYVAQKFNCVPFIYGGFNTLNGLPQEFKQYHCWLAHPAATMGKIPSPFERVTCWQYAFGELHSKSGFDEDFFIGSEADLKKFIKA
ncbi:MAG: glycoside hydrolase family 25 protein [Bdellovibrionota bacterium]